MSFSLRFGQDDLRQSHAVCGEHLLLDAADGQHQALKGHLARHADGVPHRPSGEQAHDRGRHRHTGRRAVLGHRALGDVDVERLVGAS